MAIPVIDVDVQPAESGKILYLAMAPKTNGGTRQGQLSLRLFIVNNEPGPVTVATVKLTFTGGPAVDAASYSPNLTIVSAKAEWWSFETADSVLLPQPAPAKVTVEVTCLTFTDPWTATYDLAAHVSPVTGESFLFPAHSQDLRLGEYWAGTGADHASGHGTQLFAYDLKVRGWNPSQNAWGRTLPGKSPDKNDHFRIWGKPIFAMANGIVRQSLNTMDDNTTIGEQTPTPHPVEGNHLWIQHGDEMVLYAHLQKGSLNPDLMTDGSTVSKGDLLGLAGNSGNSSEPHLHIHSLKGSRPWDGPWRPLPFRDTWVVEQATLRPDRAADWFRCQGHGFANTEMVIWPSADEPVEYGTCAIEEDQGYSNCTEQRDDGNNRCCDWAPCSWVCGAVVWVSHWVCSAWTWVSHWICLAFRWVTG